MRVKSVIIENFRGYKERQTISIGNLTAFVGKNDVGKSTVLEALDIFFNDNKGVISIEPSDVNVQAKQESQGGNVNIVIGVVFEDLPPTIIIDENNKTSLMDEYLLTGEGDLAILRKYPNGSSKNKVVIEALHPSNEECKDLLYMKQKELRTLSEGLGCNQAKNAEMRKAIREKYKDTLNLQVTEIELTKEDSKNIWDKLRTYLPVYSLFQADRSNGDKDKEVQDPLKESVKIILSKASIQQKCREIYDEVVKELQDVSDRSLAKIKEMNPMIANSLHPTMPDSEDLKWQDLFKSVSITGDDDIPINKRGSGVRRMVLLNFFRAECERKMGGTDGISVLYAIEEPETAQHFEHQKMLIGSLKELSESENVQILITTHSSIILKQLEADDIRLIADEGGKKCVRNIDAQELPYQSLNEIAFTAFNEISEEYHDELYSVIIEKGWKNEYMGGKEKFLYKKPTPNGLREERLSKTEIIRNQIHHPDNKENEHYSLQELEESIRAMREFIKNKKVAV